MQTRAELTELTRRLVSVPSHDDETAAGDEIESWLDEETDASVTRDDAGNVLARRGGTGPTLALVGHHDVVPPDPSQVVGGDPDDTTEYVVEERDGRLYGRGTADMKGAVAALMLAFRDADLSPGPGISTDPGATGDPAEVGAPELVFASFVGEEVGGEGVRAAIDDGFVPDFAVVGEGSTNYSKSGVTDVVVAHKGRRASTVVARGEACHASEPERGVNAVYRACDAVDALREMEPPEADLYGERLSGTMAVTGIDGGSAWNVVPERCEVTVDERTVPGKRLFLEGLEEADGIRVRTDQDLPPMACEDGAFADLALDAAREGQDGDPEFVTKPHATDAGWLAAAGTACVVCGPSEPGEAHTKTESVSVDVLERCYRIYRGAAERFPAEG
ncbi:M20 family metallopeptidase [Halobium salinum]|uniref:M20 family metallopeptidase n=1 Tax=Halobium salinum TaxID=1364940 RepID=A0ABD5PC20_9EURY|nr:M20/M25/M40 family metallo-hydrolase [Halobium salinum]